MKWGVVILLYALLSAAPTIADSDYVPVVLWHGMGDICCDPLSMGRIKRLIEDNLPGVYVYSVMVGNNVIEDELEGFFGEVDDQIAQIAGKISNNAELSQGFNAVGFSQGGQFLRGLAQRYNDPPMLSLITMGGQHQGVYGIPDCDSGPLCEIMERLLDLGAYLNFVQDVSVQAQYWQDPYNEEKYMSKSKFLADINQADGSVNDTYKTNLMNLKNFVMVEFENDTVVQPKESEWFGWYVPGQDKKTVPLQKTPLYIEDLLGLQEMEKRGSLKFLGCPGNHLQFTNEWFIDNIIFPYLNVTFA